jgi:D-cysteine desulfhydrase
MTDFLENAYPGIGERLPKTPIACLPTPVEQATIRIRDVEQPVWIKHDGVSGPLYGGNKIRKLEYVLHRAAMRRATRVATFGAVASNHALATAIYARQLGLNCTCLLSHQQQSEKATRVLRAHANLGTELVYYGGDYGERINTMRKFVQGRNCWVIPVGGSSWLGTVGFVSAAFELAEQVSNGELPCPDVVYVATGTMGTTAGLALGFALAGLPVTVQAVRVTDTRFANPAALARLIDKTAMMMRACGAAIPDEMADRVRLVFRDGFFAGGYAKFDDVTANAVSVARDEAGLDLETTYTGKAMAALLHDARSKDPDEKNVLFWNTYNSQPLPKETDTAADMRDVPDDFRSYFD